MLWTVYVTKKKKKIINFPPLQRIKSSRVDDKLSPKAKIGEWPSDHYFYGDNHKKGGAIKSYHLATVYLAC